MDLGKDLALAGEVCQQNKYRILETLNYEMR